MITEEELTRLQALADAATPGPWHAWVEAFNETGGHKIVCEDSDLLFTTERLKSDRDFVVASRTAVPELIAEVRRLRADLKRLILDEIKGLDELLDRKNAPDEEKELLGHMYCSGVNALVGLAHRLGIGIYKGDMHDEQEDAARPG